MKLKACLEKVHDPRGKQGQDYRLWSILGLIIVGFLCGKQGFMAVFRMGRKLNAKQRSMLGFVNGRTPCHSVLTETVRLLDPDELKMVLAYIIKTSNECENGIDTRHMAIDGKTMRATKNEKGNAAHVLSAFCCGLRAVLGTKASQSKGMEIPDALKLLDDLNLENKIITGDAMFCQKSLTEKIVAKGGDYLFPVKKNQKNLLSNIATAFEEPVFPPLGLRQWDRQGARKN